MQIRILDSELQMSRTFGAFKLEYDTIENANGLYDIVFTHRELIQDNFDSIKKYLKSTTKIVTDISIESGNIDTFLDKYEFITKNNSFDFYLLCDTILKNKTKFNNNVKILDDFSVVFYAYLSEYSDNHMSLNNTLFADTHDGFLSLNNSCRLHRVYLLTQLLKRNFSLEKCSFLFSTGTPHGWQYNREIFIDCLDELLKQQNINSELYNTVINYKLPKILDYDNTNPLYIYNDINDLYKTILNLVSENLTGMSDGDISKDKLFTFTEKTIKPFLAKQMPLFFALPGHVNLLRNLGFDVFDDIIRHDYDAELDSVKRLDMLLDELDRLLKVDLLEFKNKNQIRFDKNYNHLFDLSKEGYQKVKSFLYEEILK
jgi:hypothetical protein